jgi:hypothetical protein
MLSAKISDPGHRSNGDAVTIRALVTGSVFCCFLAFACPYTVFLHQTAGMAADFITAGAIFLFFVLTGLLNSVVALVRPAWRLRSGELIVVYIMMIVASAIPTWGLIANLLPVLPGAFYYATPENDWVNLIQPHIPEWLVPSDWLAIKHFYEGAPAGVAIPWGVWARPLAAWLVLLLAVYAVMVSFMVIMRRQWVEHERLVFPLTQVPLEMLRTDGSGSAVRPLFRSPLMWLGFATSFAVLSTHALHNYFNYVPKLEIVSTLYLFRNTTLIRLFLSFPVIGFTYFVNLEVAFSLWIFHLLARVQTGVFGIIGYQVPGQSETFGGMGSPAVSHQAMGAMVALSLFCLWNARRHLLNVARKAFTDATDVDDSKEAMSYRAAAWAMLVGLTVIALWLNASGMPLWVTPFFIVMAFVTFFGLARIIAEGGVGFCRAQMVAPIFTVYGLGTQALGPAGLVSIGLTYTWAADIRTTVMASSINGLKLADAMELPHPRRLLLAMALAIAIAMVIAGVTTLWLAYTYGGINLQQWFFAGMPRTVFNFVAHKMNNPLGAEVIFPRWIFTGIGAAVMSGLMYGRQRLIQWPLHYIGMPIGDTWVMSWVWFSVFMGWLIKLTVLRYGGVRAYRRGRPLFLGFILGQISCAGVWMVIDGMTGMVGNYIQIGVP